MKPNRRAYQESRPRFATKLKLYPYSVFIESFCCKASELTPHFQFFNFNMKLTNSIILVLYSSIAIGTYHCRCISRHECVRSVCYFFRHHSLRYFDKIVCDSALRFLPIRSSFLAGSAPSFLSLSRLHGLRWKTDIIPWASTFV